MDTSIFYRVQDPENEMSRGARRQVDKPVVREEGPRSAATHNIWSGRRLNGGGRGEPRERRGSQHRCRPRVDTGKTRGSSAGVSLFCLYFARGMCAEGSLCTYLHRLPVKADDVALAAHRTQDIFGRDKVSDSMDDRKGAGSYERTHTLYVQYSGAGHVPLPQLRRMLESDFGEWGPLQHVYIVPDKTIAFVRYEWRASAEFAKEAMNGQTLTGSTMSEALKVRWANDDPNPIAVAIAQHQAAEALCDAVHDAFQALPPEAKRARIAAAQLDAGGRVSAVASEYPDTDAAYAAASSADGADAAAAPPDADGADASWGAYPDTDAQYHSEGSYAASGEQWSGQQQWQGWYDAAGQWHWYAQQAADTQHDQQQQHLGGGTAHEAGAQDAVASASGDAVEPAEEAQPAGDGGGKAADPLGMLADYGSDDSGSESERGASPDPTPSGKDADADKSKCNP